ncbi:MAG TPA: response regulator [Dehalococcoidia bacterium]|nr:response regulator [Dehalococcoidia bacterium]
MTQQDSAPAGGQPSEPDPSRHTVLVVDDDVSLARLVRAILRTADYEVATACNGEEALEVAANVHPDVIVLDLRMPRMDGPEFFRALRARGDYTPILVASSFGARTAQKELGAEGAIEKPFDPEALITAVTRLSEMSHP